MSAVIRTQIQMVPTANLIPYGENAKIHDEQQVRDIADQIVTAGWDQPIVAEQDYTIMKGHGRWMAAQLLGLEEVPVIISDLDKETARAVRLGDNKVAESLWDEAKLKAELSALLEVANDKVALTGFKTDEIDSFLAPAPEEINYDAVDGQSVAGQIENMAKNVRKAIQIDFNLEDYDEAVKTAKRLRDANVYLGGVFLKAMHAKEAELEIKE